MKTYSEETASDSTWRKIKKYVKKQPLLAIPVMFLLRVARGFYSYRYILKKCAAAKNGRGKIYFMDYDGSGDTYITCSYLKARGMLTQSDCFVASGGLSRKIAELFDFGQYLQLPPKAALTVRAMERFYGRRLNFLPLLYESDYLEYSGLLRQMAGHRGLNFMQMLQVGLETNLGLSYRDEPWVQPEFPVTAGELDAIFQKHRLVAGKTVLIAPYAGKHDLWGIPMRFYEELAEKCMENGFIVCTNSCDPRKEPVISGTRPILIPHRLVRAFCERAGYFIGLRSGLCDMISGAKECQKIILYGNMPIPSLTATHREFFSLNEMGLCSDAVEINFEGDGRQLISEICQLLGKGQKKR